MGYTRFNLQRFEQELYKFEKMFEYDPNGDVCWSGRPEDKDLAFVVLEGLYDIYAEIYHLEKEDEDLKDATVELEATPAESIPAQVQATEAVDDEVIKDTTLPSGEDRAEGPR